MCIQHYANDLNKFLFELVVQFYRGFRLQFVKITQKREKSNEKTKKS